MEGAYKISEVRFAAHKKAKYLSQVTFGLVPVERPGIGTMAVDAHGRVYYDPEFMDPETPLEELAGVFVHECMHVVLKHADRRKKLLGEYAQQDELYDWNVAADAAINGTLRKAGIKLPEEGVFPEKLGLPENKSAEWYYSEIRKKREEEDPPKGEAPADGEGESQDGEGSGGQPGEQEGGYDGPPVDREGGQGGSSSDGEPKEWELPPPDDDNPGISEHDLKRIVRQTVQEMKESTSRGTQGGEMQAVIDLILEPKVDPLAELRATVKYAVNSTHGYGNHTYKKRNPRQPQGALRIPAHEQPNPVVKIIVDTSGSMGERDLGLALGVVKKAVSHLQSGVDVVSADTDVRLCEKVFKPEQVSLVGRGGTDMAQAMNTVMEEHPRPNVLIVVTDGETPWPDKELPAKCVAALTRKSSYYAVPDWIKTVDMEVKDD